LVFFLDGGVEADETFEEVLEILDLDLAAFEIFEV
jgi:hypothetical protein